MSEPTELGIGQPPGSSHIFNEPFESEPPELNIFGEHKTTEQTNVLSKSDVYFVSPPELAQLTGMATRSSIH